MGFVLADAQGWLSPGSDPFTFVPRQTFAALRDAVNLKDSEESHHADFFMWEHFTSKRYYDNGKIKRVGEIYTPWSSWKIVASTQRVGEGDARLRDLFDTLDKGVEYFQSHKDEAVEYISSELDYSEEDAREWLKTVEFAKSVKGVDEKVVQKTVDTLKKAGVLDGKGITPKDMIAIQRT